ncbi:MAG TPA: polysaccharide biosynthesis C-terminal domain-containing protein, partial [Gemmatimonadaceae bacterium]|nr:polysaccharide biosynthesis C-terminal domain-containing protein [Gemmatimonadaceae bacterium]
ALGGTFVYGLLAQAGNAINPHIAAELGKGGVGDAAERLRPYLVAPTRVFAALSATFLSVLAFAVPPLVQLWLPQYTPGIPAFLFYIPGFFFLSIALTAGNILNGVLILRKKQRYLIYIQMLAVLVEIVFSFLLVWAGLGLVGVALASTLSYLAYGLTTLMMASGYVIPRWQERSKFLLEVFAPLLFATIVVVGCYALGNVLMPGDALARAALQLVIVSVLGASTLWVFRQRIGIHDAVPVVRAALRRRFGSES